MKVFEILRTSTKQQADDEKTGLDTQRRMIKQFREANDLPKGKEILDVGKSARKHLQITDGNLGKLIDRLSNDNIEAGSVTFIFAFSDRFTRAETMKALEVFGSIVAIGIDVAFVDISIHVKHSDTEDERTNKLWPLTASFQSNSLEWRRRSWRTGGHHEKFREQWINYHYHGGPRPIANTTLGKIPWWHKKTSLDPKDKRSIVDWNRAKTVISIFNMFTVDQFSLNSIARKLNARKTPNHSSKPKKIGSKTFKELPWTPEGVKHVLTSPSVTGEHRFTRNDKDTGERGLPYLMENGEQAIIPDMYEQIITREQFQAAANILKLNKRKLTSHPSAKHPEFVFRGMIREGYYNIDVFLSSSERRGKIFTYLLTQRLKHTDLPKPKGTLFNSFEGSFFQAYLIKNQFDGMPVNSWAQTGEDKNPDVEKIIKIKNTIEAKEKGNGILIDQLEEAINDDQLQSQLMERIRNNNKLISEFKNQLVHLENYKAKIDDSKIKKAFFEMAESTKSKDIRTKMRSFLAETDHKIYLFQNGFEWDLERYLQKFSEINPSLGSKSSWYGFDERSFKANPFSYLKEYAICNVLFGEINPQESGFARKMFRQFFGKGEELEIPCIECTRQKYDSYFICEIGKTDFLGGCFVNSTKSNNTLKFATVGNSFTTLTTKQMASSQFHSPHLINYPELNKNKIIDLAGESLEIISKNPRANYANARAFAEKKLIGKGRVA